MLNIKATTYNKGHEQVKIEKFLNDSGFTIVWFGDYVFGASKGITKININEVDGVQLSTGIYDKHFIFSKMFSYGFEDFKQKLTGFPLFSQINNIAIPKVN